MLTVSPSMSDMLYRVALGFDRPFTLGDLAPGENVEHREIARQWLAERVERGELRRVDRRRVAVQYEWVND